MRDYGKVAPTFWTGPTGILLRSFGRDVQLLGLYLVTGPSATMYGIYHLPIPLICHHIAISREGALKGLRSLSEGAFAHYDAPSEEVFVPEMAHYQIGPTLSTRDNRYKCLLKELDKFRKSVFFQPFMDRYRVPYNLPEISPFEGASKGDREGIEAPSKPGTGTGTGTELPPNPPRGAEKGFDEFWQAYPRKESKQDARKAWTKLAPSEELRAAILAALARQKLSAQWTRDGGQFIPQAARWLNGKKWEDVLPGTEPEKKKTLAEVEAEVREERRRRQTADANRQRNGTASLGDVLQEVPHADH